MMSTIKELCLFLGKSKIKAGEGLECGAYPFYTSSSIQNKFFDSYEIESDGIIMGTGGNATLHYCEGKFSVSTDCLVLKGDATKVRNKYLYYYLLNNMYILENGFKGAGLKHTSKKYIEEIEVKYLPKIKIQEDIINVLDRSIQIINKRKEQIEACDELIKSQFIEMFGDPVNNPRKWEMVQLSEIADIKIGPFGSLLHKEDYISHGHALVNPSHIIGGVICCDENLTISEQKYEELSAYHLKKGDLVLGRRGEMGRCAVVEEEGLLCGTGSLMIRSRGEIAPELLQKIISFPTFKKSIEDKAVGQTMLNLNVPIVASLLIPKIPTPVQKEYYQFVQQVDKLKFEMQESLKELENNFNSLMQRAFKGELF